MARETNTPEGVIETTHNNTSKKIQCVYDWRGALHKIPPGEKKKVLMWDEAFVAKKKKEAFDNPFLSA